MTGKIDDLIEAFPEPLRGDAEVVACLLWPRLHRMTCPPEQERQSLIRVRVEDWPVTIPDRLYDGDYTRLFYNDKPFQDLANLVDKAGLAGRRKLMFFCLLSRHHNGFVREAALCRIAAAPDSFVAPFVAQLASEYVYEILVQIRLRLPELDPRPYGALFRENPAYFVRLRQRMISYWNVYYRWQDYNSPDGELHHPWQDRYIGFDIFDAFAVMAKES